MGLIIIVMTTDVIIGVCGRVADKIWGTSKMKKERRL